TDRGIDSIRRARPWSAQLAGCPGRPLAAWRLVHLRRHGSRCRGGRADIPRRAAAVAGPATEAAYCHQDLSPGKPQKFTISGARAGEVLPARPVTDEAQVCTAHKYSNPLTRTGWPGHQRGGGLSTRAAGSSGRRVVARATYVPHTEGSNGQQR